MGHEFVDGLKNVTQHTYNVCICKMKFSVSQVISLNCQDTYFPTCTSNRTNRNKSATDSPIIEICTYLNLRLCFLVPQWMIYPSLNYYFAMYIPFNYFYQQFTSYTAPARRSTMVLWHGIQVTAVDRSGARKRSAIFVSCVVVFSS